MSKSSDQPQSSIENRSRDEDLEFLRNHNAALESLGLNPQKLEEHLSTIPEENKVIDIAILLSPLILAGLVQDQFPAEIRDHMLVYGFLAGVLASSRRSSFIPKAFGLWGYRELYDERFPRKEVKLEKIEEEVETKVDRTESYNIYRYIKNSIALILLSMILSYPSTTTKTSLTDAQKISKDLNSLQKILYISDEETPYDTQWNNAHMTFPIFSKYGENKNENSEEKSNKALILKIGGNGVISSGHFIKGIIDGEIPIEQTYNQTRYGQQNFDNPEAVELNPNLIDDDYYLMMLTIDGKSTTYSLPSSYFEEASQTFYKLTNVNFPEENWIVQKNKIGEMRAIYIGDPDLMKEGAIQLYYTKTNSYPYNHQDLSFENSKDLGVEKKLVEMFNPNDTSIFGIRSDLIMRLMYDVLPKTLVLDPAFNSSLMELAIEVLENGSGDCTLGNITLMAIFDAMEDLGLITFPEGYADALAQGYLIYGDSDGQMIVDLNVVSHLFGVAHLGDTGFVIDGTPSAGIIQSPQTKDLLERLASQGFDLDESALSLNISNLDAEIEDLKILYADLSQSNNNKQNANTIIILQNLINLLMLTSFLHSQVRRSFNKEESTQKDLWNQFILFKKYSKQGESQNPNKEDIQKLPKDEEITLIHSPQEEAELYAQFLDWLEDQEEL